MGFKSDIEIAQECEMLPITDIAAKAGIDDKYLEQYGKYKAKIDYNLLNDSDKENGKLILVTAINPTPAGEGKTTTTVGLADGMQKLGKNVMVALREPSLGPVFGVKGGAAGGGYAQVVPMEDINLHFTGDFHAIGAANNLLAAMIDNHIFQGNALNIDPRKITWRRCVDMNDRQLRNVVDGLGGKTNGMPREDGYDITVASEIMAVLCLASDIKDLKERLSRIIIGYTYGKASEQKPVTAGDLHAEGAMTALLKDALKPNLVQTLEHVPAIVHGGPFANIAHGCNSVTATKMALKLADYAITEAGFGADLGAEKFLDIKCRMAGLKPNAVVIVATVRALKYNGGVPKADLNNENLEALEKGLPNLLKHVSNIKNVYKLPCVVAINAFPTDTRAELDLVEQKCKELGVNVALSEVWAKGGEGGRKLAEEVIRLVEEPNDFTYSYELEGSIEDKLNAIVQKIYGGRKVVLTANAQKQAKELEALGFGGCPICVAKTQYSLTDDQTKLGAPTDFEVTVRNLKISAGAGFIVAPDRRDHDHAWSAEGSGCRENRRRRNRKDHWSFLISLGGECGFRNRELSPWQKIFEIIFSQKRREIPMGFSTSTCTEFVEVLASKAPVPGGGGASALVAAVGTALGNMVGSLTVGKKKYADVEDEMWELKAKCDQLQKDFLRLIERDAEVFEPLSKAYGMPRETEEEKAEKARVMEIVLKDACSVPMEIMEKCCEAIELIVEFGAKGSRLAISDAGVGAAFCKAALKGASLNVYINTKSMADREYAEELNRKADAMLEKYTRIADETFDSVLGRLK